MASQIKNNNKKPTRRKQPAIANKFKKLAIDKPIQEEIEAKIQEVPVKQTPGNTDNHSLTQPPVIEQQISQKSINLYENPHTSDRINNLKLETKNKSNISL